MKWPKENRTQFSVNSAEHHLWAGPVGPGWQRAAMPAPASSPSRVRIGNYLVTAPAGIAFVADDDRGFCIGLLGA